MKVVIAIVKTRMFIFTPNYFSVVKNISVAVEYIWPQPFFKRYHYG